MSKAWEDYQEEAANFFRKLGLRAEVNYPLQGIRGKHKIDVYVEGKYRGIAFKWIIECKDWKSNIPKEKVMALSAIIQDVGADKGFLLSETGFQSSAIKAATKTNITLTSLNDLTSATEEYLTDALIGNMHWRLSKAQSRLRDIKKKKYDDEYYPPTMVPLAKLMMLDMSFNDALNNDYPIIYYVENDIRHQANSLEELLIAADKLIIEAEKWTPPD